MSPTLDQLKLTYRHELERLLLCEAARLEDVIIEEYDPAVSGRCRECGEICEHCGGFSLDEAVWWAGSRDATEVAALARVELQEVREALRNLHRNKAIWPDKLLVVQGAA